MIMDGGVIDELIVTTMREITKSRERQWFNEVRQKNFNRRIRQP